MRTALSMIGLTLIGIGIGVLAAHIEVHVRRKFKDWRDKRDERTSD